LTVDQASWSERLKLKAEASAIEKRVKAIEQSWGFPEPSQIATGFGLSQEDSISVLIVNGNKDAVGKMAIYHFPGSETPPGWRKRIS